MIRVKKRDKLAKYLIKKGMPVQFHYPYSLNRVGALRKKFKRAKLTNSEKWAKECISLPLHPFMKLKEARKVISLINKYFLY